MNEDIVEKAKAYMMQCTKKNLAPAWELTEIAIHYGKVLAPLYHLDTNKVLVALYLAHCVFSNERGSETMKNHTILSSEKARVRLTENEVSDDGINDICEAIKLHHSKEDSGNIFYEVVKNAEGFKFLTLQGLMIFIHHLGERGLSYNDSQDYALHKMNQKWSYMTLSKARELANNTVEFIRKELLKGNEL